MAKGIDVRSLPSPQPEHVAYLLVDAAGEPQVLLSGGALMVGTVARADLFGPALAWWFAHDLERTLRQAILTLPDHVAVCPTHGGGSFCAAGAGGDLSVRVGWQASPQRPLVLVAGTGPAGVGEMQAAVRQLARIGDDRVVGFLDGGIDAWRHAGRPVSSSEAFSAAALADRLDAGELLAVVDVRSTAEWHADDVPGSVSLPVHDIPAGRDHLQRGVPLAVHCGHHHRGTLGASLLEAAGHHQLAMVVDGWEGWVALDHEEQ